jgi:hypothetical protein
MKSENPTNSAVYPPHLAEAIEQTWKHSLDGAAKLPPRAALLSFLEVLFQASFLREEGQLVRCRVIIAEPGEWKPNEGPPSGFQILEFAEHRPFTVHEVRKLALAASYHRSLIAISKIEDDNYKIWGIVRSGARWANRVGGGRYHGPPLPPHLVVHICGPGHLLATCGYERVSELKEGRIVEKGFDPFKSQWLPETFHPVRSWLLEQFAESQPEGAKVEESFIKFLTQNIMRRTTSLVHERGHGGMLIFLPLHLQDSPEQDRWLRIRCLLHPTSATRHYNRLMVQAMRRLAVVGHEHGLRSVTWEDYQTLQDPILSELDESLFEIAHLFADLMSVDGALVLNHRFQVVGFGAEVLGDAPVKTVHLALDLEAVTTRPEPAENSGTRHRAAYRLAAAMPETIVCVISQDETIRFVANRNGNVTYWPYLP